MPARRVGEGIAAQVALARRESPVKGARHLGLAKVLTTEMPHTLGRMRSGEVTEWRATILARETGCLTREDRAEVDRLLCGPDGPAASLSDRALENAAKKEAYRLDPQAFVARARRAESERCVTIRPAPDTMTWVTALLPVKDGVSVHAVLSRAADAARNAGDTRSRGQVMADHLVALVTGREAADPTPVDLQLVMTDRSLLGAGTGPDSEAPAHVGGHGPVPAGWARDLVDRAAAADRVWLRRLFADPESGRLVGLDSRRRHVPAGLADLIRARDQECRTPWCGAPIRHTDHAVPHDAGGPTAETNLQGLCERCNHAKQAPGWRARPRPSPGARHGVEITTPTGHRHASHAPPPPGHGPARPTGSPDLPSPQRSSGEAELKRLLGLPSWGSARCYSDASVTVTLPSMSLIVSSKSCTDPSE